MIVKGILDNKKNSINDFYEIIFTDESQKNYVQETKGENIFFREINIEQRDIKLVEKGRNFSGEEEVFAFMEEDGFMFIGILPEIKRLLEVTFYKKNVAPNVKMKIAKLLKINTHQMQEIASK